MNTYVTRNLQDINVLAKQALKYILPQIKPRDKVYRWESYVFPTSNEAARHMAHYKDEYTHDELTTLALEIKPTKGLCYGKRCFDNLSELVSFVARHHDLHGQVEAMRKADHERLDAQRHKYQENADLFWRKYDNIQSHYNDLYQALQRKVLSGIHEKYRNIPLKR